MDKNLKGSQSKLVFLRLQFLVYCFFFIYINDLSDNLKCNVKLFAGDTSMFSLVRDPINTSQKLNNDLVKLVFGPINEKYPSIQIHLNKIKTLFFHER